MESLWKDLQWLDHAPKTIWIQIKRGNIALVYISERANEEQVFLIVSMTPSAMMLTDDNGDILCIVCFRIECPLATCAWQLPTRELL